MIVPMIHRTFEAGHLNAIANLPDVRPLLGGVGEIDLAHVLEVPENIALVTEHGGFVLTRVAPSMYEVHSLFQPGHGTHPIKAMRAAQEWMFTRTDAVSIFSKVPASNRAAKGLAVVGGLQPVFERDHALFGPTQFVELSLMHWAMNCGELEAHGERFHALLDAAKAAAGSGLPKHPHDAAHERAVGASLLMFERGQPHKAAAFYNLWAGVAGYQPITLLGVAPIAVDAGDAVLGMGVNGLEVLKCR